MLCATPPPQPPIPSAVWSSLGYILFALAAQPFKTIREQSKRERKRKKRTDADDASMGWPVSNPPLHLRYGPFSCFMHIFFFVLQLNYGSSLVGNFPIWTTPDSCLRFRPKNSNEKARLRILFGFLFCCKRNWARRRACAELTAKGERSHQFSPNVGRALCWVQLHFVDLLQWAPSRLYPRWISMRICFESISFLCFAFVFFLSSK